ncbi:hypothetical protein ABT095_14835 [Kitasatospora sp. NPDC002227]|uniref:hypothetical protein n=1 Tax=Kitasatospora sp. NPDC002227 TaxID=3154773 RepID=UPI0033245B00
MSSRVLVPAACSALLLALALTLLSPGTEPAPSGHRTPAATATATAAEQPVPEATPGAGLPPAPAAAPTVAATASSPTPTAAATASAMPSGAPAAADGPAADPAIEAAFVRDHPGNLPSADAAVVRTLAQEVWTAETTGADRAKWPQYFPPTPVPLRPYTQVRVQAVTARTDGDRVRVELLWAGADPSGDFQASRPGVLYLTRTATGWEPTR